MINVFKVDNSPIGLSVSKQTVGDYTDYYKHLECQLFDVVSVEWDGFPISIFVDDEGLFKPNNYGRMVEGYPEPLFGNLVIAGGVDSEGNTLSVPEELSIVDMNEYIGEAVYETNC